MGKQYVGAVGPGGRTVTVVENGVPGYTLDFTVPPGVRGYRLERFWWGDKGGECYALALAIMLDVLPDPQQAEACHRAFCQLVISRLKWDAFTLDAERVFHWARRMLAVRRDAAELVAAGRGEPTADAPDWPFTGR